MSFQRETEKEKERTKEKERDREKACLIHHDINLSSKSLRAHPSPIPWQLLLDGWNLIAEENRLPGARLWTAKRKTQFRARMAEYGPDWFSDAMARIQTANQFARGGNNGGWRIDLDYALSPSGALKLLEGGWERDENEGKPKAILAAEEWLRLSEEKDRGQASIC